MERLVVALYIIAQKFTSLECEIAEIKIVAFQKRTLGNVGRVH